jgi:hypothetical protein
MTLAILLRALLAVWERLPQLLGPAWPEVLPRLGVMIARGQDADTTPKQESVAAELVALIRRFPDLSREITGQPEVSRLLKPEGVRGRQESATLISVPWKELFQKLDASWKLELPGSDLEDIRENGRVVNLSITRSESTAPLPAERSLAVNGEYQLRLDIGPISPESVVADPPHFPADRLPEDAEGHWLDIVASSSDFLIPEEVARLFLPRASHSGYLFLPVRTPEKAGDARVRIGLYFANNLVQSMLLRARIEATEQSGRGYSAAVDYTLTNFLSDVSFLKPRTFHILTNDESKGTHRIVLKDSGKAALSLRLTEGVMRNAIGAARKFLRDAHIEETTTVLGGKRLRNRFDANNAKGKSDFVSDVRQMAELGSRLWAMLFEDRPEWWKPLRQPGTVQVSRVANSRFVFPWALVYDLALEPGNRARYSECRLLREWDNAAALIDDTAQRCPFEAEHGSLNTICPFGFWGMRHVIEQPPSMAPGRRLPISIPVAQNPPRVVAGLSRNLDKELTASHLGRLAPVLPCDSIDEVRDALARDVEIAYFYVHGRRVELAGSDEKIAGLEIGEDELLEPGHVTAWRSAEIWPPEHWRKTSPLVFINGCHTVEITPESLLSFVDSFTAANAAGVIGTEITLEQKLAGEAAELFFAQFRGSRNVGEALHLMRIRLLKKGNLLGLAYTAYCSADLKLVGPGPTPAVAVQ